MKGAAVPGSWAWKVAASLIGLALAWGQPMSAQEVTGAGLVQDPVDLQDSLTARPSPAGALAWRADSRVGTCGVRVAYTGRLLLRHRGGAGWMVFKTWRSSGSRGTGCGVGGEGPARLMREGSPNRRRSKATGAAREISRLRGLVESRREQREGWAAVAVFVSSHVLGGRLRIGPSPGLPRTPDGRGRSERDHLGGVSGPGGVNGVRSRDAIRPTRATPAGRSRRS